MTFSSKGLKWVPWLLFVNSLVFANAAFGSVEFNATVNPNPVYEGETFELTFTLSGAEWGEIELPDLSDFQRVSGPTRSFRTTIVNGQMEQKTSHTYRMRALNSGTFVIGEARMFSDGQILNTSSMQILVLERDESMPQEKEFFVRARVSCDTCYVGQQIALDLVLYTQKRIADYAVMSEPSLTGFHSRRFRNIRNFTTRRDTLDGMLYNKRVMRRYILFPQYGGKFGGEHFDLRIVEEDDDPRRRGFFRMRGEVHYTTATIPEFTVLNSPRNTPPDFNGHIGDFEISVVHRGERVRTGELIPVSVILRGDGDIASMQPPHFDLTDGGLVLSDMRLEREDLTELQGGLRATREWSVLFRADTAGVANITPYLVAYDPVLDTFARVEGRKIETFVEDRDPVAGSTPGEDSEDRDAALVEDAPLIPSWLVYTGLPVVFALALLLLIFYRKNGRQGVELSPEQCLVRAVQSAGEIEQKDHKEYASQVLQALDQYIFELTEIPMSEWEEELLQTALEKKIHTERTSAILNLRRRLIEAAFGYRTLRADEVRKLLHRITVSTDKN